jgi:hypothetical protein
MRGHEGIEPRATLTGGTAETDPRGEQTPGVPAGPLASAGGAAEGQEGQGAGDGGSICGDGKPWRLETP